MEIFISCAEEAFTHVGSLISISIILFAYINYKTKGKLIEVLTHKTKYQPLIGAIVGFLPGCGGSVILIPLFINRKITFGTIVASLISTMGDSAFLLITNNFKVYLIISILSLITGITTGYIVDFFDVGKKLNDNKKSTCWRNNIKSEKIIIRTEDSQNITCLSYRENKLNKSIKLNTIINEVTSGIGYKIYLSLLIVGFLFMIISHIGLEMKFVEIIHDLEAKIATIGIIASFIYMILSRCNVEDISCEQSKHKEDSLKETLIHSISEISFIIVWIFIAYIIYDCILLIVGGEEAIVNLIVGVGTLSVFAGAILGIIPGCGIQILIMSFYLKGSLPFAVLLANTISQDGDALFPLLALNKKAALWATIITTIPAILVGLIVYLI